MKYLPEIGDLIRISSPQYFAHGKSAIVISADAKYLDEEIQIRLLGSNIVLHGERNEVEPINIMDLLPEERAALSTVDVLRLFSKYRCTLALRDLL